LDLDATDATALTRLFDELEERGRDELGGAGATFAVTRSADMRFWGQVHQLTVPVPVGELSDEDSSALAKRFHETYRQIYGIHADEPAQPVDAPVRVLGVVDTLPPRPLAREGRNAAVALAGERRAWFPEIGGFTPTRVFDWPRLEPGCRLAGPAVVEGVDATIVVPPGYAVAVDRWRNRQV